PDAEFAIARDLPFQRSIFSPTLSRGGAHYPRDFQFLSRPALSLSIPFPFSLFSFLLRIQLLGALPLGERHGDGLRPSGDRHGGEVRAAGSPWLTSASGGGHTLGLSSSS